MLAQEGGHNMETIVDRLEKRGEKRGRLAGLREGRKEGQYEANLSIAKKMKLDGFSVEKIMEYTELSREEIILL